jgi:type I restriction-modification system DNA methylase subunit
MSIETAYDRTKTLVDKFKALSAATRRQYNEDNTRKDFILPLFEALEWDTRDSREVSAEDKVSRGWVDFAFRIGGIPRFFLETKRIAEDLARTEWVKQAIDYAWTKSVTWAVLSDFEGLRVFNAEWKEANPQLAQFIEFTIDTYLSDFERLWWLSRPEMAAGRLSREAEKYGKKSRREPVSKHLFDDLKLWRHELFRHLRAYNRMWSPAQIDEAVLVLLNRMIFLRTAEDREVEPRRLQPLVRELRDSRKIQQLLPELRRLFRDLDQVYDSQLFAPHLADELDCEAQPFETLIEGLYGKQYLLYNFNAIDADVLGAAYEQYLGHVISDPAAAEVVERRAKRKSQGIFYTPSFIVRYIVQQTLGRYLQENGYTPSQPVRILDMACGSGSFLIEAFDVLDRFVARQRNQSGAAEPIFDRARQTELLQNCIFGVDKDEQAVAVARLNLLLRALHSRDRLPMLQNIRCGDSLISGSADELQAAFGDDWRAKNPFDWQSGFPAIMQGGGFDIIIGNPPYVRIQTLPKQDVEFFGEHYQAATGNYDIYVLFVERALQMLRPGGMLGFILPNKFMQVDYGIGLRRLLSEHQYVDRIVDFKEFQVFEGATTYTCLLFLKKQVNTELTYIAAGDWLKNQGGPPLRLPVDLDEYPVDSAILAESPWQISVGKAAALLERFRHWPTRLGGIADIFVGLQTSADDVFIMDYVSRSGQTIRLESRVLRSVVPLESNLFFPLVSGTDVKRYHPLPERQFILFPYEVTGASARLIDFSVIAEKYPKTAEYLSENKTRLEQREGGKASGPRWYGYIYLKNMGRQSLEKLCVPRLVDRLCAAYDVEGKHFLDNVDVGGVTLKAQYQPQGLKYLLALLNSKLLAWYFPSVSVPFRGGWWSANRQFLSQLPVRLIDFSNPADKAHHDRIVALVDEMLALQKEHADAERAREDRRHELKQRIAAVDKAIDQLVYELYGLTDEEIKIVEGEPANE